jgi:hypothetical protein
MGEKPTHARRGDADEVYAKSLGLPDEQSIRSAIGTWGNDGEAAECKKTKKSSANF